MHAKYSFVCEAANNSSTGNLNVLGIFRGINARSFPCIHHQFTFVSCIEFGISETGKHRFGVSFTDVENKEITRPLQGEIYVNPGNLYANIHVVFRNVKLPEAGAYRIDLAIDGQHICTETIQVKQINNMQQ